MKAELLNPLLPAATLGEGCWWDQAGKRLSWVDITGRAVYRYDLQSEKHEICQMPSTVGFAVRAEKGDYIVGLQDGIYRMGFDFCAVTPLVKPEHADKYNRFNDGKCDRRGRLWAGTMNDRDHSRPSGAFYRFDERGLHIQETGVRISNGLGWSPDNKIMYYTDTRTDTIWMYDYDIETGEAVNRRPFVTFSGKDGYPDGMCVDAQGRVLTALWSGFRVEIYTPDGKLDGRIEVPAPQVSCCAFGGPDMKTLFITTASIGLSAEKMKEMPLSGQVFAVQMDAPGIPETRFKG